MITLDHRLTSTLSAYLNGYRYIIHSGGTRSGKTFTLLQTLILLNCRQDKTPLLSSVVSETYPHLRRGAIRDFAKILQTSGGWQDSAWRESNSTYTVNPGKVVEFFSADAPSKVHGPQRDILFLNEAQNISEATARHLMVRTAGTVFIDFNPTHKFWVHDLQDDSDAIWFNSTYKDNPHLTAAQIKEIERNKKNLAWWRVYGEGLLGEVEGLVIPNFEQIDAMPAGLYSYVGLDFGYSQSPTAAVRVAVDDANIYVDELFYSAGLLPKDIDNKLRSAGVTYRDQIWCDTDPRMRDTLQLMGYTIDHYIKGYDSIMWGIDLINSKNLKVTKRSINLIKELRSYMYKKDRMGNYMPKPIDDNNHAIDAMRGVVMMLHPATAPAKTISIKNKRVGL